MNNKYEKYSNEKVVSILKATEELNHLKDMDSILDKILYVSRKMTNSDAGSIFLTQENNLKFSYVHNDTLFSDEEANTELYVNFSEPINEKSIVGFVALTGQILSIDDVYKIPDNKPYAFNSSYDQKSGYNTTSMLTIPLKTYQDKLVGVMQLINAKDEQGKYIPFSSENQIYVPLFANNASLAIERGILNRELILRMMKTAELRDPHETGPHVHRVGAYSAEIYNQWALNRKIDKKKIKQIRDELRLAAMLHDVGKVGISDSILKKPGKLNDEEYEAMKWHTIDGAKLFVNITSSLDIMSKNIALYHHEKWTGGGYPGKIKDIDSDEPGKCDIMKGEEIPLEARVTALADVFDALSSKRAYKEPWPDEKIISIIKEESGAHFDPEIVEAFFQIFDVIKAIREKYQG